MVRRHVPSYQGCVLIEELSQLNVFLPLSYKSLASTPESCKKACALENYKLAVLFQGNATLSLCLYHNAVNGVN